MTCLVDGCTREAREGWAMCESDITRLISAGFGPRPIEVEPVARLSLTELPPTPRVGPDSRLPSRSTSGSTQAAGYLARPPAA